MDNYSLMTFDGLNNRKLAKQMTAIKNAYKGADKSAEQVARALKAIKDDNLWTDDFESFEECIRTFGIGKSQGYKVIKAIELKDELEMTDYNMTQVVELTRLDTEVVQDLIETGQITAQTTCHNIRLIVNGLKELPAPDEDEDDADDVEDTEDNEDAVEDDTDDTETPDDNDEVVMTIKLLGKTYTLEDIASIRKVIKVLEKLGITVEV